MEEVVCCILFSFCMFWVSNMLAFSCLMLIYLPRNFLLFYFPFTPSFQHSMLLQIQALIHDCSYRNEPHQSP